MSLPDRNYALWKVLPLALLCCIPSLTRAADSPTPHRSLALDGQLFEDEQFIEFNWPRATGSRVGRVAIQRRELGRTGVDSWREIDTVRGFARIYRDQGLEPGVAYEYRISRPSQELVETGYWVTGWQLPAQESRGRALVVVDETIADDLEAQLDRFALDLVGDGWQVEFHRVPRGNRKDEIANLKAAREIRAWIQDRYNLAHYLPHALILVGHVPVVKSGMVAPDGHKAHPHATDLFYAELNGIWRDDNTGILVHDTVPSGHIEMQVGRIDFGNFDDALGDEISLLKRYFDKNHHWRQGQLGDLRQAYGDSGHLFVELNALRNIVGPGNFVSGGHHDTGIKQPWLLGVDFGGADYQKYLANTPIKAVFTINFGSNKQNFPGRGNQMRAMLAQHWYGLTTGWGARPAWHLHHMALGKSIGYSHLRTVNNGDRLQGGFAGREYTPNGNYPWLNPVWVNLLGDPTLRPFPVKPVTHLTARSTDAGVELNWKTAEFAGATQYRIYRADTPLGPYTALNPEELQSSNRYLDTDPTRNGWYMVRAQRLQEVYAGSFYRFAQAAFAQVDAAAASAPADQSLSTPMGQSIALELPSTDPATGRKLTAAFIDAGNGGRLLPTDNGWSFIPDPDFSGRVQIPFSQFDGVASQRGLITVDVLEP